MVVVRRGNDVGESLGMRGEGRTKSAFGMIGVGFGNWNEFLFEGEPYISVKSGSGVVTVGAYALKASVVPALINSAPFGDGGLDACGVGAEDDFGPAVNVAV